MLFRKMASAAAVMAFCAFTALAQTAAMEGDVIGEDGKPMVGAVIKLVRTDVKQNYSTKTNKKGHWTYMGLAVGSTFDVILEVDGKPVDKLQDKRASINEPTKCDFDLRGKKEANEKRQAEFQKSIETGKLSDELARSMTDEQKEAYQKTLKERQAKLQKNKELDEAFNAGMTALESKQWDTAVASLTKASTLDATQPTIWANLADAYIGSSTGKTGAERDEVVAKGIEAYNKAIALKPEDAGLHNNYGRALAAAKKIPEAMAEMTKAAELDPPGAGRYYYNLGAILTNSNQGEKAVEAFQKAITADPKYADAYYQLGVSLMSKASVDTATGKVTPAPGTLDALNKYLELAPTGRNAEDAKGLIATLGGTLDTSYKNPNAPKNEPKKPATTKKK